MTVRVLMMRRNGVRLPDGQSGGAWLTGHVTMLPRGQGAAVFRCVSLRYPGDTHMMPPRHELFEPTLTAITSERVLLCGYEKKGAAAVVQEWLIEFAAGS